MKRIYFFLYFGFLFVHKAFGQSSAISGIINIYTSVDSVACDYVIVDSSQGFNAGDRALLIQMKGADIDTSNTALYGTILSYNNAGNYEFATIASVAGTKINFTKQVVRTYTISGLVQLVRVPHYINANVVDTLTASAWNGKTGGVLAFEVADTLTLNSIIDATGTGFRGGLPSFNDWSACGELNYISKYSTGQSAYKGEGIAPYSVIDSCGRGQLANGGGGGNRVNAGGGGGGNYARGGLGGLEWSWCSMNSIGGKGGDSLVYSNAVNKIFLGGGGGGGQQNNNVGTAGTRGGGIVIIKAGVIIGNNFSINANGKDNKVLAGIDAGGGGGAGGAVLLAVSNSSQLLNVKSNGGKGGNVNGGDNTCWGPGGGGGGGVIWCSSMTGITDSVKGGSPGIFNNGAASCNGTSYGALAGGDGGTLTGLILPQGNAPCGVLPVVSFQASDTTICANDCINFTNFSVNASSYIWAFPGGQPTSSASASPPGVCYFNSGNFDVTLIASGGGITDTLTMSHYITVKTAPVTPTITQMDTILYCTTDTSYTSYQWFDNMTLISGATDTSLVISQSGNYNVQVSNKNNCQIAVGINIVLGFPNYSSSNAFYVSPNPADDQLFLHVSSDKTNETMSISIMNMLGQIIHEEKIRWINDARINIDNLSPGIYFVRVANENSSWIRKFIKD